MPPIVSIIIPCRNEEGCIEACIRSILAQESTPGGLEIIVADGMSNDGTRETVNRLSKEDSRVQVIENPGRIVSTGLNAAIRAAQGEIIIRMDAHTEYAPDYVRQCLAVLEDTRADNVGGPWVAQGKGYVSETIAAAFQSPFAAGGARCHDPNYEGLVDTVYLGCWPRKVFDRLGLFDEELIRNQDDEFNLRLIRAGGKVWQSPRIRSWYSPRGSVAALLRQYCQYGYWKVRLIQKHKTPASVRHLAPGIFVFWLIALPFLSPWSLLATTLWLALAGTYSLCNLAASFLTASRRDWKLLPLLPLVFACYHFGYGYGFLRGIWDFVVMRRGPALSYTRLSRPSMDKS